MADETTETSTSGCGKLLLLSYITSLSLSLNFDSCHQIDFTGLQLSLIITFLGYISILIGSLILEMGTLSRLTGDPRFETAALRALRKLWSMRSSLNLLGTTLDVETGNWIEYSSGIGAGMIL